MSASTGHKSAPRRSQGPKRRDGSRDRPAHNATRPAPRRSLTRAQTIALVLGVALLLGATLVTVSVLGSRGPSAAPAPVGISLPGASENAALFRGIPQRGSVLGSPSAPVTLVEYADIQCPYCARFAVDVLPVLVERYVRTGKVKLVMRGLTFVGPDSERALRAALAAGRENKLWNFTHLLYLNQGAENSGWADERMLRAAAHSVPPLEGERLLARASEQPATDQIKLAARLAAADGIESTPSFMAGPSGGALERLEADALDLEAFQARLDTLLRS